MLCKCVCECVRVCAHASAQQSQQVWSNQDKIQNKWLDYQTNTWTNSNVGGTFRNQLNLRFKSIFLNDLPCTVSHWSKSLFEKEISKPLYQCNNLRINQLRQQHWNAWQFHFPSISFPPSVSQPNPNLIPSSTSSLNLFTLFPSDLMKFQYLCHPCNYSWYYSVFYLVSHKVELYPISSSEAVKYQCGKVKRNHFPHCQN